MKPPLNTPRRCTPGGIFLRSKGQEMPKDIGEIWKELTDSIDALPATTGKINGEICMIVSREEVKAAIIKH